MQRIGEGIKHVADISAVTSVAAVLTGILPAIAATLASLLTALWMGLRCYEIWTGETISERRNTKRKIGE